MSEQHAYPVYSNESYNKDGRIDYKLRLQKGMTMRQWYKGQAVKTLIDSNIYTLDEIVEMSAQLADMLVEEDKEHAKENI